MIALIDVAPFPCLVTEDGKYLKLDHPVDFKKYYRTLAGQSCLLYLTGERRPVSRSQRGYWNAVVVPAFMEATGIPTKLTAHKTLLDALNWLPGDPDPTTSDAGCDSAQMSDLILRATALLVGDGIDVAEAEPDPVRRFELQARRGRLS